MERHGLGPSVWRERDCFSFVTAALKAQGVANPSFALPEPLRAATSEAGAIARGIAEYGSLRAAWLEVIAGEPRLREVGLDAMHPGCVGLTADEYALSGMAPDGGPALVVIGADCKAYARTPRGLAVAHPVERIWSCRDT